MTLGEKLKQARLEAGLSQKSLCGDVITRNMLSQIENGSARPSMDTLAFLAARLGRPVSWFLEETAVFSPNQAVMETARQCFDEGDWAGTLAALEHFRDSDEIYSREREWMGILAMLRMAQEAIDQQRRRYALELLEKMGEMGKNCLYYPPELERSRILLLGKAGGKIREPLPDLDGELVLRAKIALEAGDGVRAGRLLDAAEDHSGPRWNFLRGEAYRTLREYAMAAQCYHRAESVCPEAIPGLEECYRELGDYKMAYAYACKQK